MTNGTRRTAAGFETTKFDKFFSISLSCGFIDTEAEAAATTSPWPRRLLASVVGSVLRLHTVSVNFHHALL